MVYIIDYTIDGKKKIEVIDNIDDLTSLISKIEGTGKPKTVILYEAEEISYKFTLEDEEEIVIKKVPKVEIIK